MRLFRDATLMFLALGGAVAGSQVPLFVQQYEQRLGGALHEARLELGIKPSYKRIDTCAAEFESFTPYMYGTYERECEANPTSRRKIMILGGGPNRIGQGIEFDYCCVHGVWGLKED